MKRRGLGFAFSIVTAMAALGACDDGDLDPSRDNDADVVFALIVDRLPPETRTPEVSAAPLGTAVNRLAPIRPAVRPPVSRGLPLPVVAAGSVVVMDEASGALLYALNPNVRLAPASLTKIATAMVVLESAKLDEVIEVHPDLDRYWLEDSATMGLEPGDRFAVRELLYGLLLASGNDAADALAEHVSGSIEGFVARMNDLARKLKLNDTRFVDPHGLGGPGHHSSALDLALLSRQAMTDATFRAIVGTETHIATGSRAIELYNIHPLLNYTPGVDGVKTGFTEEAGKTMVASVQRDGHRVYVVLLNAPSRAEHTIALIEWTFANFVWE